MKTFSITQLVVIALGLYIAIANQTALAQRSRPNAISSSYCNRDSALEIIRQQIDGTKTFDDTVQRIAVLIRAADLLWPYQQKQSRAAFIEAFDLATRNYKEKGEQTSSVGRLPVRTPDQRYIVISAIGKRDLAWARKLSDQLLQDESREAEEKATRDADQDARTGEKLLSVANSFLLSDQSAALTFARASLRYPATIQVPGFLYRLAELNKASADQLYREALVAYASTPMDQFLYLSSYPFGNNREVGGLPIWTTYQVPSSFVPNPTLQRLFVQTLLRRAQQVVENPAAANPAGRFSEAQQIWIALTRLEPQVETSLPDLTTPLQQAKAGIFPLLSQKDQQRVSETLADPPKRSFDELIEDAEKQADPARREAGLALAVLNASDSESLDHVVAAADKIDDSQLREQVLSRLYFNRTQQATKEKKLDEARKLAAKVSELDQRAFLYSQIVTESLKQTKNDVEARDMLEEVVGMIAKAPDTEVKARALLGVAYLYARVDPNRSVGILSDAVKSINRIESPDFSRDYVIKKIEGRAFGFYTTLRTPGFSPENGFRELGKLDFDSTLYQASNFTDKSLRALTTLALVEPCLQQGRPQQKPAKVKTPKP